MYISERDGKLRPNKTTTGRSVQISSTWLDLLYSWTAYLNPPKEAHSMPTTTHKMKPIKHKAKSWKRPTPPPSREIASCKFILL